MDLVEHLSHPSPPLLQLLHRSDRSEKIATKTPFAGESPRAAVQAQHRLKSEQVADLLHDYEDGAKVGALAKRYRIDRATVYAHLRRGGTPRRMHRLRQVDIDKAIRLYVAGLPLEEVSRELRTDVRSMREALIKAGVHVARPKE